MAAVFMPLVSGDNRNAALELSTEFVDSRVRYFWDPDRFTGFHWQPILGLNNLAWDVYLIYGAEANWEQNPAIPNFWMHQLRAANAPRLNQEEFQIKILELLGKSP
jgi:hypothetical protein